MRYSRGKILFRMLPRRFRTDAISRTSGFNPDKMAKDRVRRARGFGVGGSPECLQGTSLRLCLGLVGIHGFHGEG
jgi:hypothetical protein